MLPVRGRLARPIPHRGRIKTNPLELSGAKVLKEAISCQSSVFAALLLTMKPRFPVSSPVCHVNSTELPMTRFAVNPAPESSIWDGESSSSKRQLRWRTEPARRPPKHFLSRLYLRVRENFRETCRGSPQDQHKSTYYLALTFY